MKICTKCGYQTSDNNSFCPKCGQKLENYEQKTEFKNVTIEKENDVINDITLTFNSIMDKVAKTNKLFDESTNVMEKLGPMSSEYANAIKSNTDNQNYKLYKLKVALSDFSLTAKNNIDLITKYNTENINNFKNLIVKYGIVCIDSFSNNNGTDYINFIENNISKQQVTVNEMLIFRESLSKIPDFNSEFANVKNVALNSSNIIISNLNIIISDSEDFLRFNLDLKDEIHLVNKFLDLIDINIHFLNSFNTNFYEYMDEVILFADKYDETIRVNPNENILNENINNLTMKVNNIINFCNIVGSDIREINNIYYRGYFNSIKYYGENFMDTYCQNAASNYKKNLNNNKRVFFEFMDNVKILRNRISLIRTNNNILFDAISNLIQICDSLLFTFMEMDKDVNGYILDLEVIFGNNNLLI